MVVRADGAFEIVSFGCMWWLTRIVLPQVSWFVASTSQLTANSVSRAVPGSAAVGGATLFHMLAVSGVSSAEAAGALAATSILSTAALFAIPALGGLIALFGAPVPEGLLPVAVASAALFILLLAVGAVGIRYTRPLLLVGRQLDRLGRLVSRPFHKDWSVDPRNLVRERNRLIEVIGSRWPQATAASALNWVFDYLVLVAALYAIDADPRLSLVMVAYAAGAVLAMIPITPGGIGFVELGLFSASGTFGHQRPGRNRRHIGLSSRVVLAPTRRRSQPPGSRFAAATRAAHLRQSRCLTPAWRCCSTML